MLNLLFYILIALFIVLVIIIIYSNVKMNGLKDTIRKLIVYAEQKFNDGDNDSKIKYVLDGIYNLLPSIVKIFVSRNAIKRLIQKIFYELKQALDYVPKKV